MKLEFVPLLRVQRELYELPRGRERFHEYLETMIDPDTRDLRLPLAAMNPMAKDHVPVLLDEWLALNAEEVAARAVAEAAAQLPEYTESFKVALVLADDAQGGWTNRTTTDFSQRFENQALRKRGWITGLLWTGDPPSRDSVRDEVLTCIFRTDHVQRHGPARTLREMMAQEGRAMAAAGCAQPVLAAEALADARAIIRPQLDATDRPILIACLFGDDAAVSLGYTALGLGPNAGFALALHEARTRDVRA